MLALVIGASLAGLVLFVWNAISWMALPWQRAVYKSFADQDELARVLAKQAPQSGIYGLPEEPKYPPGASKEQRDAIDQAVWDRIQNGPTVTAVIKYGGCPPYPQMLAVALVTYILVAGLFGWMLSCTSGLSYAERVLFVAVAGLAAGVICRVPDWNWHQYPWNHTWVQIANLSVGWTLAGWFSLRSFEAGKAERSSRRHPLAQTSASRHGVASVTRCYGFGSRARMRSLNSWGDSGSWCAASAGSGPGSISRQSGSVPRAATPPRPT